MNYDDFDNEVFEPLGGDAQEGTLAILWPPLESLDEIRNYEGTPRIEEATIVLVSVEWPLGARVVMTSNRLDLATDQDIILREWEGHPLLSPLIIHSWCDIAVPYSRLTPLFDVVMNERHDILDAIYSTTLGGGQSDEFEYGSYYADLDHDAPLTKTIMRWWGDWRRLYHGTQQELDDARLVELHDQEEE